MIQNVFVTAVLRKDYVFRMLETLRKYTSGNFKVIVVDQTQDGLADSNLWDLRIRPNRNLGFGKGMNEGIIHGLHWKSEFITCINDDVEFINSKWWDGIIDTFNMKSGKEILAVAPESPRIPMWGYGVNDNPEHAYVEVIDYKENFTDEDYQFLLDGDFSHMKTKYPWIPDSFPKNYTGVCDAMAAWGPVCKRKLFTEIGLWDERFYPGAGEDYDMMCRIYSKWYRAVSTRKSWVWHWWGSSKDKQKEAQETGMPIDPKYNWNRLGDCYPPELNEGHSMDVWGYYTSKDGTRKPFKRAGKIEVVEI